MTPPNLTEVAPQIGDIICFTPDLDRLGSVAPEWLNRIGRKYVVVDADVDPPRHERVGVWDPALHSPYGAGGVLFAESEHCYLVRRAVEEPSVPLAEVTAALASRAALYSGGTAFSDGALAVLRGLATEFGISLDAELAKEAGA